MRILLTAAAVVFAVTSVQAQQPAAAPQSSIDQAAQAIVEKLRVTRNLKSEAPPSEIKPVGTRPVEPKPVEVSPAHAMPSDAKPSDTKPADTRVADTKPVEAKAAVTPAGIKVMDTKPVQTVTAKKPEPKRVARRQETRQHVARRIAAKYGFSLDLD